jgi:hypothetical protein
MRELRSLTQPRLHRAKETEKDYSLPKCTTAGGSGANLRAKDQQWAVSLISSNTPIIDFLWSLKMTTFLWFHWHQSVRIDIMWPFLSPLVVVWANQSSMSSWCSHPDGLNFSHKLQSATKFQTDRAKGHSKNRCWTVSRFLIHRAQK